VNDALSRAVAFVVASARKRDVEIGINDNGFFIAGKELDLDKVESGFRKLNEKNIEKVLDEAIDKTEVLKRRFRHAASRGLMILRNYKGRIKSVGKQQMSSHFLLAAVQKKTKNFPILKEARREVLHDLMDIENTKLVLKEIGEGKIKIEKKNTRVVSPFAINLLLSSHADVIRIEDRIEFIKRVYAELEKNDKDKTI
jgi:ATP-dependent Lhr-like helicase